MVKKCLKGGGGDSELAAPLNILQGANLQQESYKCRLFLGGNPAPLTYVERPKICHM